MKVSFKKRFHPTDGTVYQQAISITSKDFEVLKDCIFAEIAGKYPRRKEYQETSLDAETFLKPLTKEGSLVYLKLTQARFVNLFLKQPIKSYYNTVLIIKK